MAVDRVLPGRYEYSYRFWIDEGILSNYMRVPYDLAKLSPEIRTFVFEIRTTFMLKTRRDEGDDQDTTTIMESERYGAWTQEGRYIPDPKDDLCYDMGFRMLDYFIMSEDDIEKLANEARAFANRNWDAHSSSDGILPVAVGLNICTVQQYGEPIRAVTDRAIKPEWMIPLNIFPVGPTPNGTQCLSGYVGLFFPRIRVEDVEERLALMAQCPICLEEPIFGAQISSLEPCIVPWLETCDFCPTCRSPIELDGCPWS